MVLSDAELQNLIDDLLQTDADIISKLKHLKTSRIEAHHTRCNISNTVGTSLGVTGGILTAIGILATPLTAGLSNLLTVGGIATSVAGGATNITTSIIDDAFINRLTTEIETCVAKRNGLAQQLQKIMEEIAQYVALDDKSAALYWAKYIGKGGILALKSFKLFNSTRLAIKGVHLAGQISKTELMIGVVFIYLKSGIPTVNTYLKAANYAVKGAKVVTAVLTPIFAAIDIAFLIDGWNSDHPLSDEIDKIIANLEEQIDCCKKINEKMNA